MAENVVGAGYLDKDNGKILYVGHIPGRKQSCLYEVKGSRCEVLAYFKTEKKAKTVKSWLDCLIRGEAGE